MSLGDYMERARKAQQENEQKYDVQLEISTTPEPIYDRDPGDENDG